MATTTTNFGLKKYEGADLFNPLTYENPNSDDIDAAMFYNKQRVCVSATELTTGTVHALTKADTDAPLFSFSATSVYHAGDTFTLNGTPVTALLTSGETLPEGAYVIGSRVLGYVSGGGSLITFYVMKTTDLTPINNIIGNTDISGIADGTLTGAVDSLNDDLTLVSNNLTQLTADVHGVKNSVDIPAENLNNYTTPGVYSVYLTTPSTPLAVGELFILEVLAVEFHSNTGYVQRLSRVYPTAKKVCIRSYYGPGGGWGAWSEL